MTDDEVVANLRFELVTDGQARLRSGARRSATVARNLLKRAAEEAGVEVSIVKEGNGYIASVKGA